MSSTLPQDVWSVWKSLSDRAERMSRGSKLPPTDCEILADHLLLAFVDRAGSGNAPQYPAAWFCKAFARDLGRLRDRLQDDLEISECGDLSVEESPSLELPVSCPHDFWQLCKAVENELKRDLSTREYLCLEALRDAESYAAAAAVIGVSPESYATHLRRCVAKLRRLLFENLVLAVPPCQ